MFCQVYNMDTLYVCMSCSFLLYFTFNTKSLVMLAEYEEEASKFQMFLPCYFR